MIERLRDFFVELSRGLDFVSSTLGGTLVRYVDETNRVINRAPGLKLVVQTLLSSLRPIGNIVLICCTFFVIFGILGVQVREAKCRAR